MSHSNRAESIAQGNERLREYEKVIEGLQEMIVVVDREYRYLIANHAFLTYRGVEREQLIGQFAPDFFGRVPFEDSVKPKLDESFQGAVVKYELTHRYPGRSERDLFISFFPIEGVTGVDRVACILQDITERKRAEASLRTLSGRLLSLQDEERRRLARELHDTSAQLLAALTWNLSFVSESANVLNPCTRAALAESVILADRCLRETRTVSYLLHPLELSEMGFESAVFRYVDGFIQRSGIHVEIEVSPDLGGLPHTVETTAFRAIQECLTNVYRHSRSSTAWIRLIRGPSNLILEVEDAGCGFRGNAPSGVGIAGMRERIQELNGWLEIASHPGGTTVKATIPLLVLPV